MLKKLFNRNKSDINKKYIPEYDFGKILLRNEEELDINEIPIIYWALLLEDTQLKSRATKHLSKIMGHINDKKLINIDKQFRDKSSYNWSYDWKNEKIESLLSDNMHTVDIINIVGLSTFHPNGYFREKALNYLIEINNPAILPFVIIRCNDWVRAINKKAIKYILNYICPNNLNNIFHYYTLFMHMDNFTRNNVSCIRNKMESYMSNHKMTDVIVECLNYADITGRQFIYEKLVDNPLVDHKRLTEAFLNEPNNRVRGYIIESILKRMPDDYLLSKYKILLKDKSYKVRVSTIRDMYKRKFFNTPESILFALVDKYSAVRDFGRYLLEQMGFNDFVGYYSQRLEENEEDDSALLGLTDVATVDEAPLLKKYLAHERPQIIRKLLRCLANIDYNLFEKEVMVFLEDRRIGVSNEVKRILIEHSHIVDVELIYTILMKTDIEYVKLNAAIIICHSNKWEALCYIIEISMDGNNRIAHIAKEKLSKWRYRYNPYKRPTHDQLVKIDKIVDRYDQLLNRDFIKWYHFATKNCRN